jgi:GTP-binding protein
MIIKSAVFVKSAVKPSQYPGYDFPEVAFAGRSNVGKSSLINRLLGRKKLVKTSATPGRTQTINFFLINDGISFADLPGYGYAKVPVAVKKKWGPMVESYLRTRAGLRAVVFILDIRRSPSHADQDLFAWLAHHDIPQILVLTKTDKLKRGELAFQRVRIAEAFCLNPETLLLFSAVTGAGKQLLWEALKAVL